MKIKRRISIGLSLEAILHILGGLRCPIRPPSTAGVSVTVDGDGQTAEVTDDNPLVVSWDEEVEL